MSHRLENHKGACNNVHGHNYKLFVTVIQTDGKPLNTQVQNKLEEEGMITDFSTIKEIVNKRIVDLWDHAFIYNENDRDSESISKVLQGQIGQKVFAFPMRTTAENMSMWILDEINKYLKDGLKCVKVVLYETDTSFATYEVEDTL